MLLNNRNAHKADSKQFKKGGWNEGESICIIALCSEKEILTRYILYKCNTTECNDHYFKSFLLANYNNFSDLNLLFVSYLLLVRN